MVSTPAAAKQAFISLCIDHNILRFGEFELKSGRISPYFFNAGLFNDGRLLTALANGYADVIASQIGSFANQPMLYGPAYKGIPLAAATAVQLQAQHGINLPYAFNRKEAKDHGEGGLIVGAPLAGDVIVIDDVITAGTSINESAGMIAAADARLAAVVIAVDRQEVATGSTSSAVQEVEQRLQCPVHSIIDLDDLIDHLAASDNGDNQAHSKAIMDYREQYGISKT